MEEARNMNLAEYMQKVNENPPEAIELEPHQVEKINSVAPSMQELMKVAIQASSADVS